VKAKSENSLELGGRAQRHWGLIAATLVLTSLAINLGLGR
jgi:hypothetical protein